MYQEKKKNTRTKWVQQRNKKQSNQTNSETEEYNDYTEEFNTEYITFIGINK